MTRLRLRPVFGAQGIEVLAVESVNFDYVKTAHGRYLTASLVAVAALIRTDAGTCAFDMNADPIDPEQFTALFVGTGD